MNNKQNRMSKEGGVIKRNDKKKYEGWVSMHFMFK